jgi:6-phosphogluconolactonase (cycloisomerase 2 family)
MKRIFFNITLSITLLLTISSLNALAQGKFVYTNNDRIANNTVSGFKVNGNGTLELLPGFPAGTDGGGGTPAEGGTTGNKIVTTERGPFLFLVSEGDQEIASYQIDPNTGALTFITTKNFGEDGNDREMLLAASGDEKFLFLHNKNDQTLHSLAINNDGTLTTLQTIQLLDGSNVQEIKVSPNSKFLVVTNTRVYEEDNFIIRDRRIEMYSIAGNGLLSEVPGSPFHGSGSTDPDDAVFNCESNLLFVAKSSPGTEHTIIDVFSVAANGDLSSVPGSPFNFPELGPVSNLILSPNGKYLFASNRLVNQNSQYAIGVITIGPGGQLELPLFSNYSVGQNIDNDHVTNLAIDAKGEYLYVCYLMQTVEVLKIGANGSVTVIPKNIVPTGEEFGDFQTAQLYSLAAFPLPKKCQIIPPADLTVDNTPASACGATVKYPAATTCGSDCGTVTCDPPSGSMFAVGTHTVTCSSEGADDVTFKITVNDVTPPTIFQQPNIVVSTDPNKCSAVVNFTVSASDNCGTANTEVDFPSGSTFPKGETTVHITATDAVGNASNYSFTVTVNDTQAPTLNCQADIVVNNEPDKCGAVANFNLPMVSDNCPGVGIPSCNPPSGTFFPIGATTVTCTVTDSSQNQGQCSFKVTVKDVQPPQITCPSDKIVVTGKPCDASVLVTYPAPMATDNCPNVNVICVPPSGALFPVGTTTVTCVATDGGGNIAFCSFKVTVYDVRVQDDANPNNVILFNSNTGEYRFCSPGTPGSPFTGVGTILKKGCVATLEHNTPQRRVLAKVDPGTNKGNATLQSPPGSLKCTITDKDITNNTTICQ